MHITKHTAKDPLKIASKIHHHDFSATSIFDLEFIFSVHFVRSR